MLIITDGYDAWNKMQDLFTPRDKKSHWMETGFQPSQAVELGQHDDFHPKGWGLPKHFCIDCGKDVIPPPGKENNPGFMIFEENRPDLDVRPGDAVVYFTCGPCERANIAENQEREKDTGLVDPYGESLSEIVRDDSRAERRLNTVFEWIKAAKLRGEKPIDTKEISG